MRRLDRFTAEPAGLYHCSKPLNIGRTDYESRCVCTAGIRAIVATFSSSVLSTVATRSLCQLGRVRCALYCKSMRGECAYITSDGLEFSYAFYFMLGVAELFSLCVSRLVRALSSLSLLAWFFFCSIQRVLYLSCVFVTVIYIAVF